MARHRAGGRHARLASPQLPFERPRINLDEELASTNLVPFLDCHTRDPAYGVGGDLHLTGGLHPARGLYDRGQIADPHRLDRDTDAPRLRLAQVDGDYGRSDEHDPQYDKRL